MSAVEGNQQLWLYNTHRTREQVYMENFRQNVETHIRLERNADEWL